jgi:hypothetical protein
MSQTHSIGTLRMPSSALPTLITMNWQFPCVLQVSAHGAWDMGKMCFQFCAQLVKKNVFSAESLLELETPFRTLLQKSNVQPKQTVFSFSLYISRMQISNIWQCQVGMNNPLNLPLSPNLGAILE